MFLSAVTFFIIVIPSATLNTPLHPLFAPSSRRGVVASIVTTAITPLSSLATNNSFPDTSDTLASLRSVGTEGLTTLSTYVNHADAPQILEFTKTWDLEFRKAKMVKTRRSLSKEWKSANLPEDQLKSVSEKLTALGNAITFDLIAVNKLYRVPPPDEAVARQKALALIDLMASEIRNFIAIVESIVVDR